jgi:hypothetical protein
MIMNFLVQFIRFRRGVPEAIRTLPFAAADAANALARAKGLIDRGSYPIRTEALRVMDDGGRTLIDWTVPIAAEQSTAYAARPVSAPFSHIREIHVPEATALAPSVERMPDTREAPVRMRHHQFEVGEPISYTEDGKSAASKGGFEIVRLDHPGTHEPGYVIRSAEESSDRVVKEHELREDLGARVRGR